MGILEILYPSYSANSIGSVDGSWASYRTNRSMGHTRNCTLVSHPISLSRKMELGSDLGVELAHCDRISWMAEAREREERAMLRRSGTGVRSRLSLTCEFET